LYVVNQSFVYVTKIAFFNPVPRGGFCIEIQDVVKDQYRVTCYCHLSDRSPKTRHLL